MAHMSIIGWFIWRLTVQAKDVRLRGSRVDEVHSWMVRIWLELDSWRVVQKFLVGSSNRLIGWNLLLAERRVFEWFLELTQSRHLRDRILLFIYVHNSNKSHSLTPHGLISERNQPGTIFPWMDIFDKWYNAPKEKFTKFSKKI